MDSRYSVHQTIHGASIDKSTAAFTYPFRELFIWAALNNMQEMAMYLLEFEEEGMAKALIGCEINNSFALLADTQDLSEELQASYKQNAQ